MARDLLQRRFCCSGSAEDDEAGEKWGESGVTRFRVEWRRMYVVVWKGGRQLLRHWKPVD